MNDLVTFRHKFEHGVEEDAYHWTNPDGSKGGIVAVSATVSPWATIFEAAEIFPGAYVSRCAIIGEGAILKKGALVKYHASIGSHAIIGEGALIESHAWVDAYALIGHHTFIGCHARVGRGAVFNTGDWLYVAGPQGRRSDIVSVIWSPGDGLRWWAGCQDGITTDALVRRIETTHGTAPHAEDYLHLIRMVETHPGLARAKAAHAVKEPE